MPEPNQDCKKHKTKHSKASNIMKHHFSDKSLSHNRAHVSNGGANQIVVASTLGIVCPRDVVGRKRKANNPDSDRVSKRRPSPFSMVDLVEELQNMLMIDLADDVQDQILEFCDIPSLGNLGCCCKTLLTRTRQDKFWERPLRELFRFVYDDAFQNSFLHGQRVIVAPEIERPMPLSLWPLRSTALTKWFHAWIRCLCGDTKFEYFHLYLHEEGIAINNPLLESQVLGKLVVESLNDIPEEDAQDSELYWLFEDVPLWKYYMHAGSAFYEGQAELNAWQADDLVYDEVFGKWSCHDGVPAGFELLPNIKLFRQTFSF